MAGEEFFKPGQACFVWMGYGGCCRGGGGGDDDGAWDGDRGPNKRCGQELRDRWCGVVIGEGQRCGSRRLPIRGADSVLKNILYLPFVIVCFMGDGGQLFRYVHDFFTCFIQNVIYFVNQVQELTGKILLLLCVGFLERECVTGVMRANRCFDRYNDGVIARLYALRWR